jgi:hypothetical protein
LLARAQRGHQVAVCPRPLVEAFECHEGSLVAGLVLEPLAPGRDGASRVLENRFGQLAEPRQELAPSFDVLLQPHVDDEHVGQGEVVARGAVDSFERAGGRKGQLRLLRIDGERGPVDRLRAREVGEPTSQIWATCIKIST